MRSNRMTRKGVASKGTSAPCVRVAGKIQGTFREHSGNSQGTFREHSVRVERTPVSLHPNCKKHLKKSTKVDAEYNLQT